MNKKFGFWPILALAIFLGLGIAQELYQDQPRPPEGKIFQIDAPEPLQYCQSMDAAEPTTPVVYAQNADPETTADTAPEENGGILGFLKMHWIALLSAFMVFVEAIVRLTPTEKDNSVFNFLKYLFDKVFPNRSSSGGLH